MPPSRLLDEPIKLRQDPERETSSEYSDAHDSNASPSDHDEHESGADSTSDSGYSDGTGSDLRVADDQAEDHKSISFGALAKAQETLGILPRSKKRKLASVHDAEPADLPPQKQMKEEKYPNSRPNQPIHRTSKHAPTILSSKHPVSRKRQIFEPSPALKSRDPRFDAAIQSSNRNPLASEQADKNYSFLTTYQATEILNLRSQIKKSKDPEQAAELKRQIMSLESKIRNAETREKERAIVRKHRQEEREAIRVGKKAKPYFLKQSDVRKQINQERLDSMGKNARDKMEKRKIKKQKGKEKRDMPRFRRSAQA